MYFPSTTAFILLVLASSSALASSAAQEDRQFDVTAFRGYRIGLAGRPQVVASVGEAGKKRARGFGKRQEGSTRDETLGASGFFSSFHHGP